MTDIYFEERYARLYEVIENGDTVVWNLESEYGKIRYIFLKRRIDIELDESFFDITTPYGYGGPIIIEVSDRNKLLEEFNAQFSQYCLENNIVSEFVRFHPIVGNALDFVEYYSPIYMRKTIATQIDLNSEHSPFLLEFNQSSRKLARKAEKNGLTARITESPNNLETFLSIYHETMDRTGANDFYFFDYHYFQSCIESFKERLLLIEIIYEEKVVSSCIYFIGDKVLHEHLMGTLSEYLSYNPVYLMKKVAVEWAKDNKIELVHYGGGLTNTEDDKLFQFKRKFTKETLFDFYIGKKIYNSKVYEILCSKKKVSLSDTFFPAYRK
ncbi:peptidoglycan bridge formation glycyltransferase FemA/FemB family protein [Streptococcus suis]|nr:peptidoglycan bridge formation glycyltransferase FemA/FemB family protein [Streptococcus suis]HEM5503951.1 peptidoglycan bridge formation glycyltransferase FemA/FemB family protein [Streptococcus suis]